MENKILNEYDSEVSLKNLENFKSPLQLVFLDETDSDLREQVSETATIIEKNVITENESGLDKKSPETTNFGLFDSTPNSNTYDVQTTSNKTQRFNNDLVTADDNNKKSNNLINLNIINKPLTHITEIIKKCIRSRKRSDAFLFCIKPVRRLAVGKLYTI